MAKHTYRGKNFTVKRYGRWSWYCTGYGGGRVREGWSGMTEKRVVKKVQRAIDRRLKREKWAARA